MGPRDPVGADPEDPVGAKNTPASSVGAGVGHSESQHRKKRRGQGSKKKNRKITPCNSYDFTGNE